MFLSAEIVPKHLIWVMPAEGVCKQKISYR